MLSLVVIVAVLLAPPDTEEDQAADLKPGQAVASDYLHENYRADAARYGFQRDEREGQQFELVEKPILRWANDDDWSGDVFVWTHKGCPEVIGCILSGPGSAANRLVFHEFHLLSSHPLASVKLNTNRRWQPVAGLERALVAEAPQPAATATGRLTQMRAVSRKFTAHMQADSPWELRLLPQPLYRYAGVEGDVIDGALFAYVWTKGTDPEVLLLLEARKTADTLAWHFAPVRFSNRPVWLQHKGREVWRVDSHGEPNTGSTDLIYTTGFARDMPKPLPE